MAGTANAAPGGYRSVTPYLAVDGAARAIGFYAEAFGARERMRLDAPGGKIGHAELEIGDALVMLADPWPGGAFEAPRGESASVSIHVYVLDADAVFARALAAGATAIRPVETHFYGDRGGTLRDPFGHHWHVATRVEDLSPEEIKRRMAAQFGAGGTFVPYRLTFRLPYVLTILRSYGSGTLHFGRKAWLGR